VTVECVRRVFVRAEKPEVAVYRAEVVADAMRRHRAIDPKERPHLEDMLAERLVPIPDDDPQSIEEHEILRRRTGR
jgi:hypothetical protein